MAAATMYSLIARNARASTLKPDKVQQLALTWHHFASPPQHVLRILLNKKSPVTLDTLSLLDSNISETPDTLETLDTPETVNLLDSHVSDTHVTPDTLLLLLLLKQ